MMHKALCSFEEVPYWLLRSSIKFQGHADWKIDDLNPIWVRLQGRSQLSNPSDLPCIISDYLWSYGDHSISIFIYLFIYLIHNTSPVCLCSVKACHIIKRPPELLSGGVFLTLHYHMHFINNRNEEMQAKILEFSADRMQLPLHILILGM